MTDMNIEISERLYKNLPTVKRKLVTKKINEFAKQILADDKGFAGVAKGFYVKKFIKNPNRFKFRVNNKDRVIFEYSPDRKTIYFLDYCHHDDQNRLSSSIRNEFRKLQIEKEEYVDDELDTVIENKEYEEVTERARDLVRAGKLEQAQQEYESAGLSTSLSRKIDMALSLEDAIEVFAEHHGKHSYIYFESGEESNGEFSKFSIMEHHILNVLNRIYSDYRYRLFPYFIIQKDVAFRNVYLADPEDKPLKYNEQVAAEIAEIFGRPSNSFRIECCFVDGEGNVVEEPVFFTKDFEKDTFERSEENPEKELYLFFTKTEKYQYKKDLSELEKLTRSNHILARKNLDFIYGN